MARIGGRGVRRLVQGRMLRPKPQRAATPVTHTRLGSEYLCDGVQVCSRVGRWPAARLRPYHRIHAWLARVPARPMSAVLRVIFSNHVSLAHGQSPWKRSASG